MKGAELPINTVVIIVLALLVLLAVLAFLFGTWNPASTSTGLENARNSACQTFVTINGCNSEEPEYTKTINVIGFDANKDGKTDEPGIDIGDCGAVDTNDNLFMLCKCWYGISTDEDCRKRVCRCPE